MSGGHARGANARAERRGPAEPLAARTPSKPSGFAKTGAFYERVGSVILGKDGGAEWVSRGAPQAREHVRWTCERGDRPSRTARAGRTAGRPHTKQPQWLCEDRGVL